MKEPQAAVTITVDDLRKAFQRICADNRDFSVEGWTCTELFTQLCYVRAGLDSKGQPYD